MAFLDLFVTGHNKQIAVEIELGSRYVVVNVEKALALPIDEVHLVFARSATLRAVRRRLCRCISVAETNRLRFRMLSDYEA